MLGRFRTSCRASSVGRRSSREVGRLSHPASLLLLFAAFAPPAQAATFEETQQLYLAGKYPECIAQCQQAIEDKHWHVGWRLLKIRSELTTGQYAAALATYEAALDRYGSSIPLRLLSVEVLQYNNRPQDARAALQSIQQIALQEPWRYSDGESRTALGLAFLRMGADARQVLELFFDQAKKNSPASAEPWLASGELGLEKQDFALAAESFREAIRRAAGHPDAHWGLARALVEDSTQASAALAQALALNPRHLPSLLWQVDQAIDAEQYAEAEGLLGTILAINPHEPRAWAYRAVLAHLHGRRDEEQAHRLQALAAWKTNPEVDHLIGRKLSQAYRFAAGAAYQRQALAFDADYRPARIQLSQDLLRLGQEEEGWRLAGEVFAKDRYHVVAYNLVTLQENLARYRTLESSDFLLRMEAREAELYGLRVLDLLHEAKRTLCDKYRVELSDRIVVEIFSQQKDFAIRTFGLPGGAGFLGVCFGGVITANSPASQGETPSNWEAVLWHEFCHVVTLQKTGNKLPRWLSEGISVYEERQRKASWGQAMTPMYRDMILREQFPPVSDLSSAFLRPPSPLHLQFAYFQSSMVIEFLVGRFGPGSLQHILEDLGRDVRINEALARHTVALTQLDQEFAAWFRQQAEQFGADVDWEDPQFPPDMTAAALAEWNVAHPRNYRGLLAEGQRLLEERRWQDAIRPLQEAAALYGGEDSRNNPHRLLALAHRELQDAAAEQAALEMLVAVQADAHAERLRLAELAAERQDWPAVREHSAEALAVNPLVPGPHRLAAQAADALERPEEALRADRALLLLNPLDPAELHFRLARRLHEKGDRDEARREVLKALELAPRYLDAHRLLLRLVPEPAVAAPPPEPAPAPDAPAPATDSPPGQPDSPPGQPDSAPDGKPASTEEVAP